MLARPCRSSHRYIRAMAAIDGNVNSNGGGQVTVHRLSIDGGPRFSLEMQDQPKGVAKPSTSQPIQLKDYEISYQTCLAIFFGVLLGVSMIPLKEYYLGSYVTKPFDEVRDEIAARKLNQMGVVMSGVHYFDTFERSLLPLIDLETKKSSPVLPPPTFHSRISSSEPTCVVTIY